jgi:hypothetical protein
VEGGVSSKEKYLSLYIYATFSFELFTSYTPIMASYRYWLGTKMGFILVVMLVFHVVVNCFYDS